MADATPYDTNSRGRGKAARSKPLPDGHRINEAFNRLGRQRALHTLVRGALSVGTLRRLLKDAMPQRMAREMPPEVWASLAVAIALESAVFAVPLIQALHDALAWDREPKDMDGWWQVVRERPLEALWMAALSENKAVRKEFPHMARHCLENHRSSPACPPPSWEFVEALQEIQALSMKDIREAEKKADDAERRLQLERERLDELREELKRLRRETSELRGEKAQAERRIEVLSGTQAQARAGTPEDVRRLEDLERRVRKAEKEREHLARELERARQRDVPAAPAEALLPEPEAGTEEAAELADEPPDDNPRRRLLRHIVRKLFKKGKIGASHTHEDNVYRGVPDHEKGLAKDLMDLLYREGFLVPKPTLTDPHVSLNPDRTAELHGIIQGEIRNPRLSRFVEG